jgi:glycine/D-amino acid oxidase-like deaminating enzyme
MPLREIPYWWTDAPPVAEPSPGPFPERVDVAVIGAGYTGLAAARRLRLGGASVAVLEAESLGWGASSRNGGQVLTGLRLAPEALLRRYGRDRARELHRASLEAIGFLEAVVAEEGIDCEFARCGHLEAAAKPRHFAAFERTRDVLGREFDHPVEVIPAARQEAELASPRYHGLLLDPASARVQPAKLVQGLAAAARRAGADLHPATRVLAVERRPAGFEVRTARGPLRAEAVLVATNGYTTVVPDLRRRVVAVGSYVVATEPLGPARAAALIPRDRVVFDSKHFVYYFRLSRDRRLVFGGRAQFTPATPDSTRRSAEILRRGMLEVFPSLADVRTEFAWSGNVCFTRDELPRAGRLGGLHFALGYGGHGVAMAAFLGDRLGQTLLTGEDQTPFRDLGFPVFPLYDGRPWFLPLAGLWYRLRDWLE